MQLGNKILLTALFAFFLAPSLTPAASAAEDKERVLRKLDAAAASFHATSADFQFETVQTDPIPDKDVMKGTAYYERKGTTFRMAAHIREKNGRAHEIVYVYSGGALKYYDSLSGQTKVLAKASSYESYLMLGFGASGKELEEKWDIKYLGEEMLSGVQTEKLELVAKDPSVRKNIPKVIIWVDSERGVSLKQHFDEGAGTYRDCFYSNFKINQSLPSDAFVIKTDSKTVR
jgi:outer membrane lipoprotein-sorting protein